ncbi:MAG: response regulator, partial [Gemmatimonadetes bacterium]|nr:response regulator [Gemmatimonadota bacterium]
CIYDAGGNVFATYQRDGQGFVFPPARVDAHRFEDDFLHLYHGIRRQDELRGTVYLRADMGVLDDRLVEMVLYALLVLGFGGVLSVVLSVYLQRMISDPVINLTATATNVTQTGHYAQRVPRESDDEIGDLCDGFNDMLDQIQRRDAELRQAQEVLEGRVGERTTELSKANAALQAEILDHERAQELIENINEQLVEARDEALGASRAKSTFLANMSHEIRTPMNAILGYAQILRDAVQLDERQRHAVSTIERSGDHLLALINDILDISKIEAGRLALIPQDFDITGLMETLSTMFELRCRDKGLTWSTEITVDRKLVHGDANKLRQVLINLLGNAVKFTEAGSVILRLQQVSGQRYHIAVTDTGPGIDTDRQEAIFEPFDQGALGHFAGGTGLGLTIARQHVELMGAELQLDSTPGEGTCFYFEVDLTLPTGRDVPTTDEQWIRVVRLASDCEVRALVVDDITENREVLASMVENIGVTTVLADGGEQALAAIESDTFDIVFLDIRMPGMDGSQVRKAIMERLGNEAPKIVAVTASALAHQRDRFLEEGFDSFIDKPFRRERIYGCLHEMLGATFEFVAGEAEPVLTEEVSLDSLVAVASFLPDPLFEGLVQATQVGDINATREHLDQVHAMGGDGVTLARQLRTMAQAYDMRGISDWLESIDR